jgi:hypothetical protein
MALTTVVEVLQEGNRDGVASTYTWKPGLARFSLTSVTTNR